LPGTDAFGVPNARAIHAVSHNRLRAMMLVRKGIPAAASSGPEVLQDLPSVRLIPP
jgi:hypothetical protein